METEPTTTEEECLDAYWKDQIRQGNPGPEFHREYIKSFARGCADSFWQGMEEILNETP